MISRIAFENGSPRIEVNGQTYPAVAFMTYHPTHEISREFREIGMPVFSFGLYASDRGINDLSNLRALRPNFWIGEDEYDFSDLDSIFEMAAPGGKGAFIFPRVDLDAPSWWIENHPEELARDDRNQPLRQSLISEKWREDAKKALRALIDHVNASKWKECVIGYHIAAGATEEWTHHQTQPDQQWRVDYSKPSLDKFHSFLINKYGTVENLNSAWKSSYSSFDDVPFPRLIERIYSKNGIIRSADEQNVIDFWAYNSFIFSDTILCFTSEVKRYTNRNLLTGAFYGYFFLYGMEKGHYDMRSILDSEDIDFVATTSGGTGPGGGRPFGTGVASLNLHGKMYFNEGDIRTCLNTVVGDNIPEAVPENSYYQNRNVWRGPSNMFLSLSALKKATARVLTGHAGIWLFDMFGGWFRSPRMMEYFRRFIDMQKEQTASPIKSEIAVLVDEEGFLHYPRGEKGEQLTRHEQMNQLDYIGAPYDLYLASDLMCDSFQADQYKMFVMINCVRPSKEFISCAEKKLKNNHKTIVWTYFDDFEGDGKLTGLPIEYNRFALPRQGRYESTVFPPSPVACPSFREKAIENAYVLSSFEGSSEPAVAAVQTENFLSVVSVLPYIPHALLKEIAVFSGVNLYSRTDDVIMAGGRFVAVHALTGGEKRLNFPFPISKIEDAETGANIPIGSSVNADFQMEQYETRIFKITP